MIKMFSKWFGKAAGGTSSPDDRLAQEIGAIGAARWLTGFRQASRLHTDLDAAALKGLRNDPRFAALRNSLAEEVERLLRHEFDLLGSGPFVPHDPDRPAQGDYAPIDWYLDPVRQLRFPTGIPHKQWDLYAMRPGHADIKYPWELARCQHWPTLAQHYRLTGDQRCADEIINQLDDFMSANPVGIGVNWTCTMDVAIRAANWAIALHMLRHDNALDEAAWWRALGALFAHGEFIHGNLENHYEVTSNHYLSNVVGLHFIAAIFADLPSGRRWNEFCRASLETEITVQVLEDGADFESSVPYHRLVSELFLGSARLAQYTGAPLAAIYHARLADMMTYHVSMLRPDGRMAVIGDADDGRLHIFTGYGRWDRQDGLHLLAPAGATLGRPEWLACAGPAELAAWELAWWGFDPMQVVGTAALPPVRRQFPQAGHAVYRQDGTYLAITNAIVGTKGFGNHKHNDQLGFELHWRHQPLFVDAGSYVYTSDFAARNLFRGTGYHNTLTIDDSEQNETRPDWIFRLFDSGKPEVERFETDDGVLYAGRHIGYRRLPAPADHRRVFRLLPDGEALFIRDRVETEDRHKLTWHFHAAPGLNVVAVNGAAIWLATKDMLIALISLDGMAAANGPAWYSPSYGVRQPCQAIEFTQEVTSEGAVERQFLIASADWLGLPSSEAAMHEHVQRITRVLLP